MGFSEEESIDVDFGDARLLKRFKRLMTDIYDHARNSIPAACGGWNETVAAYCFFNNEKVSLKECLSGHYEASLARIRAHGVVLIPQDTTQLIREVTKKNEVIKGIREKKKSKTFLHANVAFNTERTCLGYVGGLHWSRGDKKHKKAQVQVPIEDKESVRWLNGYGTATQKRD